MRSGCEFRSAHKRKYRKKPEQLAKANAYQKKYHEKRSAEDPEYREWYRTKQRRSASKMRQDPEPWSVVKEREKRRRQRRRDKIAEIKVARGCELCGYNEHPAALDFDHVSGEKFNAVSRLVDWSWARILEEIAKCRVLCANCHRIVTTDEQQHKKTRKQNDEVRSDD